MLNPKISPTQSSREIFPPGSCLPIRHLASQMSNGQTRPLELLLTAALLVQPLLNLRQREAIHDVLSRQPAFARDLNPEPEVLQAADGMGIRVN